MPTPLTDADKVLRNDTGITIATNIASIATALGTSNALSSLDDVTINTGTLTGNQALVYDAVAGKWVNSNLIVPDELNDLSDVSINTPLNRQELVYNDALEVFQNKTTRVELTMAQYNQLVEDDHVLPNVDYYITDAPSMQGTSQELSYDGDTDSVYDVVEGVKGDISDLGTNKANKTQTATFSPETGVQVMHISTGYTDKQGCISGEIRFTQTANAWKDLGTLSIKPNDICQVCGVHTGTGAFLGIVRLQPTTGKLQVYPVINISNDAVGFSISFITA